MPIKILIAIIATAAGYALFVEIRRGRSHWKLVEWLRTERTEAWEAVHVGRRANVEDSMARLRQGRLSADDDFLRRHDIARARGRGLAVAIVVAGTAVVVLLAGVTILDW